MEFEFEEKEQYTHEDVKGLLETFKTTVGETIKVKDETIVELTGKVEGLAELELNNKELSIKNLALVNGIGDDMLDLIRDDDLEVVKTKIELVKGLQADKDVENSYKPEQKRKDDDYEKAIKSNDIEGALKSKLSRLFN